MTSEQRKALLNRATQFRKASQFQEAKGVAAAIRVLDRLEKITHPKGKPCLPTPQTTT